jgi:hypothetical protein
MEFSLVLNKVLYTHTHIYKHAKYSVRKSWIIIYTIAAYMLANMGIVSLG